MSHPKHARTQNPIHELIAKRYSPYTFDSRPVGRDDLAAIFEAAAWAASSYNEQPWRYIVAVKENGGEFDRLLSCLGEANQAWARNAPVLVLGVTRKAFSRNERPNRVALHDLGAASATLTFEATSRGLSVHQMAGILPDRARETCHVPPEFEVVTAIAIGYAGNPDDFPGELGDRDRSQRTRRSVSEYVFGGDWEKPAF